MTTLDPKLDGERLGKQLAKVREFTLQFAMWWTLQELGAFLRYPEASISARLRELRSMGYTVERRRRGEPSKGLWEYRVSKPVSKGEQLRLIA